MAAGIPIVPIVIRNAELIAARNSTTMNPGTVDVAVFPPISVRTGRLGRCPDRIAEVRQLYVDTLADWPVDELPKVGLCTEREKKPAPRKAPRRPRAKPPRRRRKPLTKKDARKRPNPKPRRAKPPRPKESTPRPERAIVTTPAADTGSPSPRRRHVGVGVGVVAGGIGAARGLAGPATCPAPGDQARGDAAAGT